MMFYNAEERPYSQLAILGTAVRQFSSGQRHVGILYQLDGQETRLCHLAFHFRLCDELPSAAYVWADCGLDDVNKKVIAAYIGLIRRNKDRIPYGLDADGNCFDPDTGEYIEQPLGKGLTCATFIMAIFARFAFRLLKTEEWPERADDIQWQQQILQVLREEGASADHVDAAQKDIGAARFRPEEVGGAVSEATYPVGFERVSQIVEEIMTVLGRGIGER